MEELYNRLCGIDDSYFEFVDSVMSYVKQTPKHLYIVADFLNNNESASSSDVLRFIIKQPDFFEKDVLNLSNNQAQL